MTLAAAGSPPIAPLRTADFILAGVSGVLLALPYLLPQLFLISWIAFVPLLFALRDKGPGQSYLLGVVTGLTTFVAAAWWIIEFITRLKGYDLPLTLALAVLFWVYSAQLFGLLALAFAWLRRRSGVPDLVLFPVLLAVFFALFPMLFHIQLGESQSRFLVALQAISCTGVHGLDAVIALSSIVVFKLLSGRPVRGEVPALSAAVAVIALWLGFGFFSLSDWDRQMESWQTRNIGFVQHNTGPLLSPEPPTPGYSRGYPRAMELTEGLADAGAELVLWPETRFIQYFSKPHVRRAFESQVADMGVPLLFQDMEQVHDTESKNNRDVGREYNTALLLNARGEEQDRYRKIRRVAFGEYLPLVGDYPRMSAWVTGLFGGFYDNVSAGTEPKVFGVAGMSLVPLICYEAMFPELVANATAAAKRKGQVLAVLSNNAWFGATRQPYQHLNASVLRAVENRAPLVHVINNGPSGVVLPNGRFLFQAPFGEEAGYLVDMPYSPESGGSFFTRNPYLFSGALYVLLAGFVLSAMIRRRRSRRGVTKG
ncbi:apolipoprotein N-acyltransferase [Hydrocarboniclastica marina]|uniref:Apolipoprotein N-acyltransferase n=1 Tax=Hydrocarboniclastica marina TaxID=2259620 RepID=A0A4P7XJ52_9ALTE|nr:apolipoprotein N-acyltransferase [Hydrocarboniclastica marina]QCF27151.1 apolipoprotein N-acyltransferase [Hydrocarboniclastica marina]